ncbi:neuronal PAS domain-containing protein 4A-like isoform X1 [Scleropages formosus]|uniref:neuronal PAS domain-containing protein 4A-like isoform X1 n=1 Tax=Scleropages formosus TaxID=113540 RepID=UPI0010FA768F|nr:neuronal PAS domain-containing protein 4A-like isoform X1 [Scleropages formosus]
MYRSTKGASKARRDQINAEIRNLKELLPISEADKARLSYLHIMSLACMYTRKSVFFSQEAGAAGGFGESASVLSFHELSELVHGLPGFLMLLTTEGKLLYLSDSVSEHLGHSMVDLVAQGDSVYDIIDPGDHFVMRSNLVPTTAPDTDRLFRCRFNTAKSVRRQSAGTKAALIRTRCLSPPSPGSSYWTSNPVWVCFCSPLEAQQPQPSPARSPTLTPPADHAFFLACFHSQHSRDMRLQDAQDSVNVYLGYSVEALRSHSWYSLVHPEDLSHASAQHCRLLSEGGEGRVEMVLRVEAADHSWVWLYMVLHLESGETPISCHNYVISESEAWSIRQQLCAEQNQLALALSASASYQHSLGLQSPETLSSPDQVFTPSSSGLSGQSFDFSSGAEQGGSGTAAEPAQPEGGHPRSSLSSLEEESSGQQSQPPPRQQQQPPQPGDAASPPTPTSFPESSDLDFLAQSIFLSPPLRTDTCPAVIPLAPPPLTMPNPYQGKESLCTPPYTPQLGVGSFMFGEGFPSLDTMGASTVAAPTPALSTPTGHPPLRSLSFSVTRGADLLLPLEHYSGTFYEKLPPTPDTPGDSDCTVMPLPEVGCPLFVDVPAWPFPCPPESLLTPEASPGKQPCLSVFAPEQQQGKERTETSLVAQNISSLAERFYPDGLFHKILPPSPTSPVPSPLAQEVPPMPSELYPLKSWKCRDVSLSLDDIALIEECILEALLEDLSSSPPSPCTPSPCPSSTPSSSPAPPCWCPPSQFEGASLVGLGHFCSVQSAQRNSVAGGGATTVEEAGAAEDEGGPSEDGMEVEEGTSPPQFPSTTSVLPPLSLLPARAAPVAAAPSPVCAQPLLEELAALEPMFGAGASTAPAPGQQLELYQLHRRSSPRDFQPGERESELLCGLLLHRCRHLSSHLLTSPPPPPPMFVVAMCPHAPMTPPTPSGTHMTLHMSITGESQLTCCSPSFHLSLSPPRWTWK